ncbi:hypothetical protein [Parvibaculum sp.]|uniref:hypothetical protein n=1 Tax=Parvibaculum sp. TaxID=2024848 RepID=UPI002639DE50|nr:hypothetical protein [Parvibaculum sp.]MCW5728151.1 hypothetical protein [Parvibaculum sp.]
MIRLDAPYTDELAALLNATAPHDFPLGDLAALHAAGEIHFAVADDEAVVAWQVRGDTLEIVGLNAEASPFSLRSLWADLEAYALGHTAISRMAAMVENRKMQMIVAHFGLSPRAVMYTKAVA